MRAVDGRVAIAGVLAALLAVGLLGSQSVAAADGPTLSVGDQSGLERDAVTGSVFVPVYLSEPAADAIVVSYWTADGTATAGADYIRWGTPASPRTVTIPAGAIQTQVNVPVLADGEVEPDETFSVLVSATGADVVVGDDTGTATIVDTGGLSAVNPVVTVSNTAVIEGDSGVRRAQFLVHLSRAPETRLSIAYATAGNTALDGTDYTAIKPGAFTFAPGQISKTFDVEVIPNTLAEGPRDFTLQVTVTGGSPVEELNMAGTATIVDDDPVPAN